MKVLHLCLGNYYIDHYSYQENMLTKHHKLLGHDVEIIASLSSFDENGKKKYLPRTQSYLNEDGILVTRLNYKRFPLKIFNQKFKRFIGVYEEIEKAEPDIIFIHNFQFLDIYEVIKYIKNNPSVSVYVDSHIDFSNSAKNWLSKNILHKVIWRKCAHSIEPYTKKFYGVLPARVDFLTQIYKLPEDKVEYLPMGVDDEISEQIKYSDESRVIRKSFTVEPDDFLIVTGGKIDPFKKQTLLLMEAVKQIHEQKIKLLLFGSVTKDLKEQVNDLCDGKKIHYGGWLNSEESYAYFEAADLVVFPGRHSVFWEQVAGQGIPMMVKYWEGTTHIDVGGNVLFLYEDSVEEIKQKIMELYFNQDAFHIMKNNAETGRELFRYSDIAKKSIGTVLYEKKSALE